MVETARLARRSRRDRTITLLKTIHDTIATELIRIIITSKRIDDTRITREITAIEIEIRAGEA